MTFQRCSSSATIAQLILPGGCSRVALVQRASARRGATGTPAAGRCRHARGLQAKVSARAALGQYCRHHTQRHRRAQGLCVHEGPPTLHLCCASHGGVEACMPNKHSVCRLDVGAPCSVRVTSFERSGMCSGSPGGTAVRLQQPSLPHPGRLRCALPPSMMVCFRSEVCCVGAASFICKNAKSTQRQAL